MSYYDTLCMNSCCVYEDVFQSIFLSHWRREKNCRTNFCPDLTLSLERFVTEIATLWLLLGAIVLGKSL